MITRNLSPNIHYQLKTEHVNWNTDGVKSQAYTWTAPRICIIAMAAGNLPHVLNIVVFGNIAHYIEILSSKNNTYIVKCFVTQSQLDCLFNSFSPCSKYTKKTDIVVTVARQGKIFHPCKS